ncbi:TPK3 [Symbiodinium microadriaticum]|nr:TPK3 [Symbiodinium sp. KB8]CAE7249706.1 TPK3 [Symbiodinium microadriaticum]
MGSSPCACVSGFEFRRVKFAKYKPDGKFYTVKFMKKHEIIKLKQVDHINNEKRLMAQIAYPFIVNMMGYCREDHFVYIAARQHGAFVEGGVCKGHGVHQWRRAFHAFASRTEVLR